jgi:hypothetical protein
MAKTKSTGGSYSAPSADDVIQLGEKSAAENRKLTISQTKLMDEQARNEYIKSMHELQAKSIKSAGEAIKGLG